MNDNNSFERFFRLLRTFAADKFEYAKLTAVEKVTVMLGAMAIAGSVFIMSVLTFFFLSLAVVQWIAIYTGLAWAYAIICAVWVCIITLLLVFRKILVLDPIARFISRIVL